MHFTLKPLRTRSDSWYNRSRITLNPLTGYRNYTLKERA